MSDCLNEETLLSIHEGEGAGAQESHLETCKECAARYQLLKRDLEAIGRVLQRPPPARAVHSRHSLRPRWVPVAVSLALAIVLVWGGVRMWRAVPPVPGEGTQIEDVWQFLEEVSTAPFLAGDAIAGDELPGVNDLAFNFGTADEEYLGEPGSSFFGPEEEVLTASFFGD